MVKFNRAIKSNYFNVCTAAEVMMALQVKRCRIMHGRRVNIDWEVLGSMYWLEGRGVLVYRVGMDRGSVRRRQGP